MDNSLVSLKWILCLSSIQETSVVRFLLGLSLPNSKPEQINFVKVHLSAKKHNE